MKNNNRSNRGMSYGVLGAALVVISLVSILLFLMNGNKTIISDAGDMAVVDSMSCENQEILYPFFKYDHANTKSIKINMIFSDKKLDKITLTSRLYYNSEERIKQSSDENHAAMNLSFNANGMGADSFNALFSNLKDAMQMTLYAHAKDLKTTNDKFFLIESAGGYTMELLEENYNRQGFNCVIKGKE